MNEAYKCGDAAGEGLGDDLTLEQSYVDAFNYAKRYAAKCANDQGDLGRRVDSLNVAYDVAAISEAVNDDASIYYWGKSNDQKHFT